MKQFKMNYAPFIVLMVFAGIFIAAAVTFLLLPSEIFGSSDGQTSKIIFGAMFGLLGFIMLMCSIPAYKKQKNIATQVNELLAQLGDNALVFKGKFVDPQTARENAKKTAVSVAIASVFAMLFGFGVYRVRTNGDPTRIFVIADDGMRVIHPHTTEQKVYKREYKPAMTVTAEKHGQVKVQFVDDMYYKIATKKTDVDQEWLQNRLYELFKQQTPVVIESPFEGI